VDVYIDFKILRIYLGTRYQFIDAKFPWRCKRRLSVRPLHERFVLSLLENCKWVLLRRISLSVYLRWVMYPSSEPRDAQPQMHTMRRWREAIGLFLSQRDTADFAPPVRRTALTIYSWQRRFLQRKSSVSIFFKFGINICCYRTKPS